MDERRPDDLPAQVARRERRKLRARREREHSLWFGLGTWGLIGWSVAVPTLVGVAVGAWIDAAHPSRVSWTLMLLAAGLGLGCWTAWYWLSREQRMISRGDDEGDGHG
jgi:ATP synthase protein I